MAVTSREGRAFLGGQAVQFPEGPHGGAPAQRSGRRACGWPSGRCLPSRSRGGTRGPEGAGPRRGKPGLLGAGSGREGANPGGPRRGWFGASSEPSGGGGQVGVAIPVSQVGPPRLGEARQPGGGDVRGTIPQCRDRWVVPPHLSWRWAGSGGGTLAVRRGQLWQEKPSGGEAH